MKYFITLLFVSFFSTLGLQAQDKKTIQIKIKKQGKTILDTTITESDKNIKPSIERIVGKYTNEEIYIDSDKIHGLYVFEIQDNHKKNYVNNDLKINIDSIFTKFGQNLERCLEDFDLDSISAKAVNFTDTITRYSKSLEPDIQKLKQEIRDLTEKIRKTQIIIIEKGDTIKIPE